MREEKRDDVVIVKVSIRSLDLEPYCPEDWNKNSPMDNLLLQTSFVHRGEGSLEVCQ